MHNKHLWEPWQSRTPGFHLQDKNTWCSHIQIFFSSSFWNFLWFYVCLLPSSKIGFKLKITKIEASTCLLKSRAWRLSMGSRKTVSSLPSLLFHPLDWKSGEDMDVLIFSEILPITLPGSSFRQSPQCPCPHSLHTGRCLSFLQSEGHFDWFPTTLAVSPLFPKASSSTAIGKQLEVEVREGGHMPKEPSPVLLGWMLRTVLWASRKSPEILSSMAPNRRQLAHPTAGWSWTLPLLLLEDPVLKQLPNMTKD